MAFKAGIGAYSVMTVRTLSRAACCASALSSCQVSASAAIGPGLMFAVAELRGHSEPVNALCWNPNADQFLCSGAEDAKALIWDVTQKEGESREISSPLLSYQAQGEVAGIDWSLTENLRVRAMRQRAVRAPNVNELYRQPIEETAGLLRPAPRRLSPHYQRTCGGACRCWSGGAASGHHASQL